MADRNAYSATTPTLGAGEARKLHAIGGSVAIVTADLAINKTVALFKVPAGFTVVGHEGHVTDMDSNGSPALVFTIGDATDPDRLLTTSTAAQAGGAVAAMAPTTGLGYRFTEETEIVWTTTTAAATAAAGTVKYFVIGYFD